jgi:hypothetical protein
MDYSYLGSGRIFIRIAGAAAALIAVGNCSALAFNVTEDVKELKDFTQPGGGTYNEVRRIQAVEMTFSAHDLSPDNLARALYGTSTVVAASTVTAETVVGYKGGIVPLAKLPLTITSVEPIGGGTPYVAGDDYILTEAGLEIPADSAIPDPVAGAANFEVDYTSRAFDLVQALTEAGKEYEVLFEGLNEARSGKPVVIRATRIKLGAARNLSLIGEDYAVLELTGKVLKDTAIVGAGLSQYFNVKVAA